MSPNPASNFVATLDPQPGLEEEYLFVQQSEEPSYLLFKAPDVEGLNFWLGQPPEGEYSHLMYVLTLPATHIWAGLRDQGDNPGPEHGSVAGFYYPSQEEWQSVHDGLVELHGPRPPRTYALFKYSVSGPNTPFQIGQLMAQARLNAKHFGAVGLSYQQKVLSALEKAKLRKQGWKP